MQEVVEARNLQIKAENSIEEFLRAIAPDVRDWDDAYEKVNELIQNALYRLPQIPECEEE